MMDHQDQPIKERVFDFLDVWNPKLRRECSALDTLHRDFGLSWESAQQLYDEWLCQDKNKIEGKHIVRVGECGPFYASALNGELPLFDRAEVEHILTVLAFWNQWDWVFVDDTLLLCSGDWDETFDPEPSGLYALIDPGWEYVVFD